MRTVKKNTETRNEATIIHAANNYHIIITITHANCIRTNSAAWKQFVSLPGSTHTNEARKQHNVPHMAGLPGRTTTVVQPAERVGPHYQTVSCWDPYPKHG